MTATPGSCTQGQVYNGSMSCSRLRPSASCNDSSPRAKLAHRALSGCPSTPALAPARLLEKGDPAVMLHGTSTWSPGPKPEAIAESLGQRYLPLRNSEWRIRIVLWQNDKCQDCGTALYLLSTRVKCCALRTLQSPSAPMPHLHGRQDEKPRDSRACRLAPCISSRQTLEVAHRQWNTQAAFREHRAHTSLHAGLSSSHA